MRERAVEDDVESEDPLAGDVLELVALITVVRASRRRGQACGGSRRDRQPYGCSEHKGKRPHFGERTPIVRGLQGQVWRRCNSVRVQASTIAIVTDVSGLPRFSS